MRAPGANTTALHDIQAVLPDVTAGIDRSAIGQSGFQVLAVAITVLIAVIGGSLTGKQPTITLSLSLSLLLFVVFLLASLSLAMDTTLYQQSPTLSIVCCCPPFSSHSSHISQCSPPTALSGLLTSFPSIVWACELFASF